MDQRIPPSASQIQSTNVNVNNYSILEHVDTGTLAVGGTIVSAIILFSKYALSSLNKIADNYTKLKSLKLVRRTHLQISIYIIFFLILTAFVVWKVLWGHLK